MVAYGPVEPGARVQIPAPAPSTTHVPGED